MKSQLVNKLLSFPLLFSFPRKKVGAWIDKLTKSEREELKTLTAKDFNHRIK